MPSIDRRHLLIAGAFVLALAVSVPVLAAANPPARSDSQAVAAASPKPAKQKTPEISVTVTGTVNQGTDGKGRPTYTLTAGGTSWELSAGPSWFWADDNPLVASVGKSVTVIGTHHEGSTELSVGSVDGKATRAAGKPPWAGGPFVVGEAHPGWKEWMADGKPGRGLGRDGAPGQNKDKTPAED